jgi:PIN domain nuclease of toxin-antitoxin system
MALRSASEIPILLDTCAAIWIVDDRISQSASDALSKAWQSSIPTHVSPITAWEIGHLAASGRFKSPDPPTRWFQRLLDLPNVRLTELPPRVLLDSSFLPGLPPRDPADRIIAATARDFGFTVMTRDRALLAYAKEGYLSVITC